LANPIVLSILEASQAGEARRKALSLASHLGFNETERGKVGIVVTEMANNLVRHARNGKIVMQVKTKNEILGIEILALDSSPGMHNIDECLRDGFSTAGTSGSGLGAIARLSNFFDIYSVSDVGTALVAHLWSDGTQHKQQKNKLELGVVCLPKIGEEVSGDAWTSHQETHRCLFLVADGLGHGPEAAKASLAAVEVFHKKVYMSPRAIVEATHKALQTTRGAALAIAELDLDRQIVNYTGIGNIASTILTSESSRYMVSHNGTVGYEMRKTQEFTYPWSEGALLIMHTDGLKTQWRLEQYPGLFYKHPSLIAGILYRDFSRERDDVTVLVARISDQ
jgi:anti-sigma regulatory factor (Ser/Thr protein kinase)